MEQKTDLQIAQELKYILTEDARDQDVRDFVVLNKILCKRDVNKFFKSELQTLLIRFVKTKAKSNLKGLGCGKVLKRYNYATRSGMIRYCGKQNDYRKSGELLNETPIIEFCPDCLAKGVDKAKKIYEGVLK